jgi:guanylate kinase
MREIMRYDYVVENRELRRAVENAKSIVSAERMRVSRLKSRRR